MIFAIDSTCNSMWSIKLERAKHRGSKSQVNPLPCIIGSEEREDKAMRENDNFVLDCMGLMHGPIDISCLTYGNSVSMRQYLEVAYSSKIEVVEYPANTS
jgi:hypothetical protein